MAIKSKGKFIDFLRLVYAFLSAAGKRLGLALRHARERAAYWYDSQEVKPQDKAASAVKRAITIAWYREMDDRARAKLKHLLLRMLVFIVMLAGVLNIAVAFVDFKDILAFVVKWDGQTSQFEPEDDTRISQYFLMRVSFEKEWIGAKEGEPKQPAFASEFAKDLVGALRYSENVFSKKQEIEDEDVYREKFIDYGYRFFICGSQRRDAKVLYSNWDFYKDDYAAILMPDARIDFENEQNPVDKVLAEKNKKYFDKIVENVVPTSVADIYSQYGRYISPLNQPLKFGDQDFYLYLAISDYNVIETRVGARALALLIIGALLALASVMVNSRISAKYKYNEGRLRYFNRTSLTLLLAGYLLAGFAVVTTIFFSWFVTSGSYISYDTNKQTIWTYSLSVLYALMTFAATSAIGNGLAVAHQNAMLLKKMKAELVANVSHDIKTPLTSIIGYVGLLEQDPALSDESRNYVNVLKAKSERLKSIVSDLFELSKSTAGNGDIKLEKLDLKKLIEQTLADMEDAVTASGRIIRRDLPDRPVFIRADGSKLYRVFQNVIGNALKYSDPNIPILLNCRVVGKRAIVEIKNTASYKMDFSAEEVLSRYARGKGTMAEDGIGLGLSIADTFVKECGGELRIKIEEDQFRIFISLRTV